jgi:hypothetical protein
VDFTFVLVPPCDPPVPDRTQRAVCDACLELVIVPSQQSANSRCREIGNLLSGEMQFSEYAVYQALGSRHVEFCGYLPYSDFVGYVHFIGTRLVVGLTKMLRGGNSAKFALALAAMLIISIPLPGQEVGAGDSLKSVGIDPDPLVSEPIRIIRVMEGGHSDSPEGSLKTTRPTVSGGRGLAEGSDVCREEFFR